MSHDATTRPSTLAGHRPTSRGARATTCGPIDAIGPARVVLVSSTDTGWGNGDGWVSYQLTGGRYAGAYVYVYVAEGITPTVIAGETVAPANKSGPSTATPSRSDSPTQRHGAGPHQVLPRRCRHSRRPRDEPAP